MKFQHHGATAYSLSSLHILQIWIPVTHVIKHTHHRKHRQEHGVEDSQRRLHTGYQSHHEIVWRTHDERRKCEGVYIEFYKACLRIGSYIVVSLKNIRRRLCRFFNRGKKRMLEEEECSSKIWKFMRLDSKLQLVGSVPQDPSYSILRTVTNNKWFHQHYGQLHSWSW